MSEEVRASDRDREEVLDTLRRALQRGSVTLTEFDERLAAAYECTTRAELAALTRDLPGSLW